MRKKDDSGSSGLFGKKLNLTFRSRLPRRALLLKTTAAVFLKNNLFLIFIMFC